MAGDSKETESIGNVEAAAEQVIVVRLSSEWKVNP